MIFAIFYTRSEDMRNRLSSFVAALTAALITLFSTINAFAFDTATTNTGDSTTIVVVILAIVMVAAVVAVILLSRKK